MKKGAVMKKEPHRIYTIFRNMTFAAALLVIFGEFCGSGRKLLAFAVTILLLAAAVALALIFPVRQDKPIAAPARLFFGIFGGLGMLLMIAVGLMFFFLNLGAVEGGSVDAEFATYSDLTSQRIGGRSGVQIAEALPLDAIIPPEARKIHFKGRGGGLFPGGRFAEFSCSATEADFMKFALARGYLLETNRLVNANAKSNGHGAIEYENYWRDHPKPGRYYSYTYIFSNNGGIWLMFDPATETLRGFYSSN